MSQRDPQTTARSGSLRAKIIERLNRGQLNFDAIWRQMRIEMPGRQITWNYVQRIGREWALKERADGK